MNARATGLRAGLRQTFTYAIEGLRYAIRTQRTFRIHLLIAAAIGLLVIWLRMPPLEIAVVVLAMAMVLAAELFNTGVEAIADLLVERNAHRLAKMAKDIAAGAVLVTSVAALVVGVLLLGPPLVVAVGLDPDLGFQIVRLVVLLVVIGGAGGLVRLFQRPRDDHGSSIVDRREGDSGHVDDRPSTIDDR